MPTGLIKPIPTSESQKIFNRTQGWQAPLGWSIRAIGFDDSGQNSYHAGDYVGQEGARRDMARQLIVKYKFFDREGTEVLTSF